MAIYKDIENIIAYALSYLDLDPLDVIYTRNTLFDVLNLAGTNDTPSSVDVSTYHTPNKLLTPLMDYALEHNVITRDEQNYLEAKIMGILSLKPSEIEHKFNAFDDIKDATDWFYNYCIKNNYIQQDAIGKNIRWTSHHKENPLEITINLSKPEKDNKNIRKELNEVVTNYPKSMIAFENVGFRGHQNHPSRQNIRVIDVTLNKENWFWQYSPYAYYKEHLIVINKTFIPMAVNQKTFVKLLDFVEQYPHYYAGSNASLPIIGGSILNHEHYQGGYEKLPMHYAKPLVYYKHDNYPNVEVSRLDWYNNAIQVKSKNKEDALNAAHTIFKAWENYSNLDVDIVAFTEDTKHNSAAVIVRYEKDMYIIDLILRNNQTNDQYPDGIFHAHPEYHNIKSEGIGLIEAMGLFILPPRLNRELAEIETVLNNSLKDTLMIPKSLTHHQSFIENIYQKIKKQNILPSDYASLIRKEIDIVCENILYNTAVFKKDKLDALDAFMNKEGFINI